MHPLEEIRGKDHRILLGVTGGIASGKTTVARMLKDLGAPIIDFDLLSREVVEPQKPAWKEIIDYFGKEVLFADHTLDRKKLSQIIFNDLQKREKLESVIHPRVYEECARRVKEITQKNPNAIIQVVVPLLFEVSLQRFFHKVLLVYIPKEIQAERLMKRDRISREMAGKILDAQLPIEEKKELADFIVDNSGTLEETQRHAVEVWKKLKQIQKKSRE
jgi:dephospho-CoA kinase